MKKIKLLFLLFITTDLISQTIVYNYTDINNHSMTAKIMIQKEESIFVTLDNRKSGIIDLPNGDSYGIENDSWSRIFYKKNKSQIIRIPIHDKELIYNNYPISIKYFKESKTIGKFVCQKALITKGGVKYEVWFDPNNVINDAPWGLYGLPGLVVEVNGLDDYPLKFSLKSISRDLEKAEFDKYQKFILSKKVLSVSSYEDLARKEIIERKKRKMAKLAAYMKKNNVNIEISGDMDVIFYCHLIDLPNGLKEKLKLIK
ncbi:GLPGLI family protein [Sandaracinomonas limnophila]|uniref:GLPGLI family protein n=1 Tax=Sandaracinomonas limnophila TaxID=1862386 RepID=A0A437PR80_9BACT|nr:GLPGLI family protein [Sandaracinomonas limnophila]RVU24764.1 GLPGLI family protein [Sandaracinomonas limnophila]